MKTTQYDPHCPKQSETWPAQRLNVPQTSEPIRKPLIECELDSMRQAVADLTEEIERLGSRLEPVLSPSPAPAQDCPNVKAPERVMLPQLGESLRTLLYRVETATSMLRVIRNNLEI